VEVQLECTYYDSEKRVLFIYKKLLLLIVRQTLTNREVS